MSIPVPLTVMGGLVCSARPEDVPEGASPRTHDTDFLIGRWRQRDGLRSLFTFEGANVSDSPGAASGWVNSGNLVSGGTQPASTTVPSGSLDLTQFAFSLPMQNGITGVVVAFSASATTTASIAVELLVNGAPAGSPQTVSVGLAEAAYSLTGWDAQITNSIVNSTEFGVRFIANSDFPLATVSVRIPTVTIQQTSSPANFVYVKSFVSQDGSEKTFAIDANGNWWIEDVGTLGSLTLLRESLLGRTAQSLTQFNREYVAFSNFQTGSDLPLQYTDEWIDKITQVGPGAPPQFAASTLQALTYPISTITQPAAQSRGFSYFLRSTGPGSNSPGTTITIYYSDSTTSGPDTDLVNAFNSGNQVLLFMSFNGPVMYGPHTVKVTSVGEGAPPGQPRQFYYFTFADPEQVTAYTLFSGSGHSGYVANYQRTLATMTTTVPVPSLSVGGSAVIVGNSVSQYNSTWKITQTPNSGAMQITQSSLIAGVATYSYSVTTGANPTVGQQVTITNTLNANGMLNGPSLTISAVSGTNTGTFQVSGFSAATDYAAQAESGQAVTAGTLFTFEPGQITLGSMTSPIYGTGTGGNIEVTSSGQFVGAGTYQGVQFFGTRNGAVTFASNPVTFTVPQNATGVMVTQLAIGPPNTAFRGVALTEPGANGVPGANFYYLPTDQKYTVNGTTFTATSFLIQDNTTTSKLLTFQTAQLISATAIDIQGNNLFNQIEVGHPAWMLYYANRLMFGLTNARVQNFVNLSFDGGRLANTYTPLGWTTPDTYGQLIVSPEFGDSYYIHNTTSAALPTAGLIAQTAYQDYYNAPIVQPNLAYSVRVTARSPSGFTGALVVDLFADGIVYGSASITLTNTYAVYDLPLLTKAFTTVVPPNLMLRVYAQNIGAGEDVEIDSVYPYLTSQPVLTNNILVSYANNPEGVDAITGSLRTDKYNSQTCYGAAIVDDRLYLLKEKSTLLTEDSPSQEPSSWTVNEVSNRVGTCGIHAFDYGDDWFSTICRSGVYGFKGRFSKPLSRELQSSSGASVWDSINWNASETIWHTNDITNRRMYFGVPMATPNFWLPDAPTMPAPTSPNVILMLNYEGCSSFDELVQADPVYTTTFGDLRSADFKRKWSLWQIPSPYAGVVTRPDEQLAICNGIASGKVYGLDSAMLTDDGAMIPYRYSTFGFPDIKTGQQLQLGAGRKMADKILLNAQGSGRARTTFYPNTMKAVYPQVNAFDLVLDGGQDNIERRCEVSGDRVFVEFTAQTVGGYMECGDTTLKMRKHPWSSERNV